MLVQTEQGPSLRWVVRLSLALPLTGEEVGLSRWGPQYLQSATSLTGDRESFLEKTSNPDRLINTCKPIERWENFGISWYSLMRYLAFFTLLSVGTPMIVTNAYIRRLVVPPNGLTTDFDSPIICVPTASRVKNARYFCNTSQYY